MLSGECMRRAAVVVFIGTMGGWLGCFPARPLSFIPPQDLLAAVVATPGAHTIQAKGTIRVVAPEGVYQAGILAFYRDPDSLKILVQVGLGTTVAEVALTGVTGIAYLPQQRQAFALTAGGALVLGTTPVYPFLLMRLMRPVSAEDMGNAPTMTIGPRKYILRSHSPAGTRTWEVNGRTGELEAEEFAAAEGTVSWRRTFTLIEGQRVPLRLSLRLGEATTVVHFTHTDVSPRWKTSPFRINVPPDIIPLELESY